MKRLAAFALVSLAVSACNAQRGTDALVKHAELGVFFGGQVQERDEIPFELDATKQSQGFRIDLSHPPDKPHHVRWEIDRPASGRHGVDRVVSIGEADIRVGQARFDQSLPFKPGDPLGVWNVRVLVDGDIVIDRELTVFDAAARRRLLADGGA